MRLARSRSPARARTAGKNASRAPNTVAVGSPVSMSAWRYHSSAPSSSSGYRWIELEPLGDQRPRVLGFVVQAHEDHRVEGVDRSHEQGLRVPVAIRSREGSQIVVAPRVLPVAPPRVLELRLDALRQPRRVRLA